MELNETNRLGQLPFLENLLLRGNGCCEQKTYRTHVLAHFGERAPFVSLDGEGITGRERVRFRPCFPFLFWLPLFVFSSCFDAGFCRLLKEEVNTIQEKIKQEKAKVTTKSLIAKKKTKTRVVDILPPKKKKDKKEETAQLADLEDDLNVNGASVAETISLDVERILSKYGGAFLSFSFNRGLPSKVLVLYLLF